MNEILSRLPEPMQLNETTLVIAALFLVMIGILNYFVFKPLVSIMDERQRKIKEGEEAATLANQTVADSRAAYQLEKRKARKTAQSKRQEMLAEAERTRSEMVDSAKAKARDELDKSSAGLKNQVEDAKTSLKQETREIAEKITATILSRV